jgi:hypothetical protein
MQWHGYGGASGAAVLGSRIQEAAKDNKTNILNKKNLIFHTKKKRITLKKKYI